MMMMQQQSNQETAMRQAESNKQLLLGLVTSLAPLVAGLMTKGKDDKSDMMALVTAAITNANNAAQEQNKILLTAALNKDDFGKQLELFEKFKALTDDSPLGEIAKIVDAAGLGNAIGVLADGAASRLKSKEAASGPPAIEPPAAPQNGGGEPANPYAPEAQQTTVAGQTTQAEQDAAAQFTALLEMLKQAFVGGQDAKALAAAFWEQNKAHKENILRYEPQQIAEMVKTMGPKLGYDQLSGTDAQEYTIDFANEVKRLATEG
jgi:hypothetical protein